MKLKFLGNIKIKSKVSLFKWFVSSVFLLHELLFMNYTWRIEYFKILQTKRYILLYTGLNF